MGREPDAMNREIKEIVCKRKAIRRIPVDTLATRTRLMRRDTTYPSVLIR
jgi:hypothetical protein